VHPVGPPPYLPPGRIVDLPGRGETFVRVGPERPGAPTVLLLHGWMGSADLNWFALYRPLAASLNLLALDHRGHGRGLRTSRPFVLEAAADDAAALLDELGVATVIACGFSMGGPIALHLARRRPDLVGGLVLCATALEWNDHWHERLQWRLLALVGLALRFGADRRVATRIIDELAAADELVAAYRPYLLGEANRLSDLDALAAGRALAHFDARPFARQLGVPCAVVATRRDRMVRLRRQVALAEALDAARFDLEADHDVFLRQPGAWASTVTAAIASVQARLAG
jgi:3-oxoadipate enol-lactonase